MARPTKYAEVKLCNSCILNINYRKFRLIKLLTKELNKVYIKGNIEIVSNKANRIKTDATVDEI